MRAVAHAGAAPPARRKIEEERGERNLSSVAWRSPGSLRAFIGANAGRKADRARGGPALRDPALASRRAGWYSPGALV